MGRESSHGTKERFNLPPLVLKARHPMMALPFALDFLGWKCLSRHWVGYPYGYEDKLFEFSCQTYMYSETCLNDHLNAATTSLHCPETTVPTDSALKETVTGLAYGGHLSTADYGHYAAPLLTDLHAMLPRMATTYWPETWGVAYE